MLKSSSRPYTAREKALARKLYADAEASGTLKSPRGLFAVRFGSGGGASASSPVTWRDYLRDARAMLTAPRSRRARRR